MNIQENKDTTHYIWDITWRVRVPLMATTSEEYLRHFGMPSSGDPDIDRELNNQWIDTLIPISTMVDYHRRGIPVKVVKYDDAKLIYDYIEKHLQAWVQNLKHGLNIGNAPVEDLIAMNEFANTVYTHARAYYTESTVQSSFMRAIENLGMTPMNDRFRSKAEIEQDDKSPKAIGREDLSKVFKSSATRVRRWN